MFYINVFISGCGCTSGRIPAAVAVQLAEFQIGISGERRTILRGEREQFPNNHPFNTYWSQPCCAGIGLRG